MTDICAIVLAAGEGSRFGGDDHKLRTKFKGKPLVLWAVEAALAAQSDDGPIFGDVYVVTGAVDLLDLLPETVTVVDNHSWADGQAVSLRAGVAQAEREGYRSVVVGLGDQPLVPASAWAAVANAEGPVVTATFDGHRTPPVKFTDDVWGLLPISGDEGARGLLRRRPELVQEIACDGRAVDVDTLADLDRWG